MLWFLFHVKFGILKESQPYPQNLQPNLLPALGPHQHEKFSFVPLISLFHHILPLCEIQRFTSQHDNDQLKYPSRSFSHPLFWHWGWTANAKKANTYHCILKPCCWGHSGGKCEGSWPRRVRASLRKISQRQPKTQLLFRTIKQERLEPSLEIHEVDLNRHSLPAAIELWTRLQENALRPHQEKAVCRPTQGNKKLAKFANKTHWH